MTGEVSEVDLSFPGKFNCLGASVFYTSFLLMDSIDISGSLQRVICTTASLSQAWSSLLQNFSSSHSNLTTLSLLFMSQNLEFQVYWLMNSISQMPANVFLCSGVGMMWHSQECSAVGAKITHFCRLRNVYLLVLNADIQIY